MRDNAMLLLGAGAAVFLYMTRRKKDDDIRLLAAMIYGEAAAEPWIGKVAVAWVARNRVYSPQWPNRWREVLLQPYQFTSLWNAYQQRGEEGIRILAERARREEYTVAKGVYDGKIPDPTGGATHYHAEYMKPKWAKNLTFLGKIGHHLFYR